MHVRPAGNIIILKDLTSYGSQECGGGDSPTQLQHLPSQRESEKHASYSRDNIFLINCMNYIRKYIHLNQSLASSSSRLGRV